GRARARRPALGGRSGDRPSASTQDGGRAPRHGSRGPEQALRPRERAVRGSPHPGDAGHADGDGARCRTRSRDPQPTETNADRRGLVRRGVAALRAVHAAGSAHRGSMSASLPAAVAPGTRRTLDTGIVLAVFGLALALVLGLAFGSPTSDFR